MLAAVAWLQMPLKAEPVEVLTLAALLLVLSAGVTDRRLSVVLSFVTVRKLRMGSADGRGAEPGPAMVAVPLLLWEPASGDVGDSFQGGLIMIMIPDQAHEPGTGQLDRGKGKWAAEVQGEPESSIIQFADAESRTGLQAAQL